MILGIHHVSLATTDLARLRRFYCEILQFEVISQFEWSNRVDLDRFVGFADSAGRSAMLRLGDAFIELFEYRRPQPHDTPRRLCDPGYAHVALLVRDIDGEYQRLHAAGVEFNSEVTDSGKLRAVYGRDPDGNVFELVEVTSPASRYAPSSGAT
ncbi:MAG: VOC family protein [Steroidobacteraceae bacterium]